MEAGRPVCPPRSDRGRVVVAGLVGQGPSGAGKSTMLDILAMRKTVGTITGQILVNG